MTDPIPKSLTKAMEEILQEELLRGNKMSTTDYVEYVAIYQDRYLNKYTDITDIAPHLSDTFAIEWLENQAEKQGFELVWVAKADKTVFHDEDTDTFNTVYNTDFKQVEIYSMHPPKRFRDTANAE